MKMYKGEFGEITEIEVEKVTPKFVFFRHGQKEKVDSYKKWYRASWEAVKQCMLEDSLFEIKRLEFSLDHERKRLEEIKAL